MSIFTGNILVDLFAVIVALFAVCYTYIQWNYSHWKRKNIPYFPPQFPYGNRQPLSKSAVGDDVFNLTKKAKANGWDYFGIFIGMNPIFVPVNIELTKSILIKDFNYFPDRAFYYNERDDPISAHLFAVGGSKWRRLRTKLTPTFTSGKMKGMFQTVIDCSKLFEKALKEHDSSKPLDIKDFLISFTTDVIGSCGFGLECNSFKESNSPFKKYGMKIFNRNLQQRLLDLFVMSFPRLALALHVKRTPNEVRDFYYDVVDKAIEHREKNNYSRKDFLQLLIDINKNKENRNIDSDNYFTRDEMVAQCFVLFLAGLETSSTAVTFTLYELAQHSEIQEKVREELFRVLEKYNNELCYDALKDLEYMQQVIDEALRKYPPGALIARKCVQDYKVPGTDLILEKGTGVIIPIQQIHYDEDFYDDPEKFDPDRFSPEQKQNRNPLAHIPFGEGPRICIGMRFGLMESKIALATVLRNFRVKLNPKTKVPAEIDPMSFVTTFKGGVWLDIEKVN